MSETINIVQALAAVMEEVQAVRKDDRNVQQGFNFRGIDAVVNAVGPALRKHGVVVVPVSTSWEQERYQTSKGTQMRGVTLTVRFRFYGPAGDYIEAGACGEASDSGDKAISKAHSVAYRTVLLEALCIPTGDPDPDSQSHERAVNGGERVSDPHGLASARADALYPSTDPVIHFGKNSGTRLSELAPKQLQWYAETWEPKPEYANETDHALKAAAVALHSGVPAAPDPDGDLPF